MQQTNLATVTLEDTDKTTPAGKPSGFGDNIPFHARSTLINRNIMVGGRRTSVRLEPEMWTALLDIARRENQTIHALATQVAERKKPETSLTAAIRVFCLAYYRSLLDTSQQKSSA